MLLSHAWEKAHRLCSKSYEKETFWAVVPCPRAPLKKPAAKAKGGPDPIHQPSLKLGGGKKQSYIKHMPDGPGTSLRLIIAFTAARAKFLKISHEAFKGGIAAQVQEKGATKASIFAERETLYKNFFASSDPRHGIQFIPSDILSGKSSGILFGILFETLSGISSGILSVISSDILSGISTWHSIWHIFRYSIWHIS